MDGEGISDSPDAAQRYTLLASSLGTSVSGDNLSSERCFDFLLSLPKRALKVGFSIRYDVDMWLQSLPLENLQQLWEDGRTEWRGYWLVYHPGKMFSVGRQRNIKPYIDARGMKRKRVTYEEHVTIWDVFSFFQGSFVKALGAWDVGSVAQRDQIAVMKERRSVFTDGDEQQILEYCIQECRLLATLMEKLLDYTQGLGLRLCRYDGAGAVASAILRKHHVAQFISSPPHDVHVAALHAYFGGRFETSIIGYEQVGHVYDINSAYPSILQHLPCLAHGRWSKVGYTTSPNPLAVYHVIWDCEELLPVWGPFPYRTVDNAICYPMSGEGWYWGAEVRAAMQLYPERITVIEGFQFHRECGHQPFAFIPEYYSHRRALKAACNFGEIILKLGLNSLYGKCAQSIGGKVLSSLPDGTKVYDKPTYQSFVWAGMITAGTRAIILDALRRCPEIISIATDGVISRKPIDIEVGDELGQWNHKVVRDIAIIQNGVYQYVEGDTLYTRARGFAGREFDWGNIAFAFGLERAHAVYSCEITRFIGLGSALQRNPPLTDWRRWRPDYPKTVKLRPSNRLLAEDIGIPDVLDQPVQTYAWVGQLRKDDLVAAEEHAFQVSQEIEGLDAAIRYQYDLLSRAGRPKGRSSASSGSSGGATLEYASGAQSSEDQYREAWTHIRALGAQRKHLRRDQSTSRIQLRKLHSQIRRDTSRVCSAPFRMAVRFAHLWNDEQENEAHQPDLV